MSVADNPCQYLAIIRPKCLFVWSRLASPKQDVYHVSGRNRPQWPVSLLATRRYAVTKRLCSDQKTNQSGQRLHINIASVTTR